MSEQLSHFVVDVAVPEGSKDTAESVQHFVAVTLHSLVKVDGANVSVFVRDVRDGWAPDTAQGLASVKENETNG